MLYEHVLFTVAVVVVVVMNAVLVAAAYRLIKMICLKALDSMDKLNES